jgi:hypothetical protein
MIIYNMFAISLQNFYSYVKKITMKPNSSQLLSNSFLLLQFIFSLAFASSVQSQCMILGDSEICKPSLGFYEDTASYGGGTITHLWFSNGGGVVSGPNNQSEVQIFWSTSGNWVVYNKVYQNGILIDICSFNVEVSEIEASLKIVQVGHPIPIEGNELAYCIGDEIEVIVEARNGTVDYVWHLDGADVISMETSEGIEIGFVEAGTVQICANVTNDAGCQVKLCTVIEVIDPSGLAFVPFPQSGNGDSLLICKGQQYWFNNLSDPIPGFGYRWTVAYNANTWTY